MAEELIPELRAAADRLMHTEAYLRHIAAELRPNEHERHCKATGLSVRQTCGHLAQWLEQEAATAERFIAGEPVFEEPFDEDALNREFSAKLGDTSTAALVGRFGAAREQMLGLYSRVTPEMAAAPVGDTTFGLLLLQWTAHPQRHALDFAEALPRLRFDPLLLDWALAAELRERSELERQLKLAEAARAYLRAHEEPDDA